MTPLAGLLEFPPLIPGKISFNLDPVGQVPVVRENELVEVLPMFPRTVKSTLAGPPM
jgi:hypothetical protein